MPLTAPLPDFDWPILEIEDAAVSGATAEQKAIAQALAVSSLRMLTLGRVGGHPVVVIPAAGCRLAQANAAPAYPSSTWVPCPCQTGCSCPRPQRISLPGPVGSVSEVSIDGDALPVVDYRLEGPTDLVRIDGQPWPTCGTSVVITYVQGYPVDGLGEYAAGVLTNEFLRAMLAPNTCRLPAGVISIARQGTVIEVGQGLFPGNITGLTEVDAFVKMWNPHRLVQAPTVSSPDIDARRLR